MTEIRTPHLTDNSIFSAAMWNNGFRASMAEIQALVMFLMHGKTASAGAAGVAGGFELSTVTGQMQVTVAPGWAWFYDSTIAAPASPFAAFNLLEATAVNIGASDATHARYDLISIENASETDTQLSVPQWEAANANRDTQRGSVPTLTVTAGTPGAFPTIPATPSGHIALGAVRVGATVTNLNSATLIDLRDMLSLTTRGSTRALRFRSVPNTSVVDAAEFILAEFLGSGVADGSGSKLKWDRTNDWLAFRRVIATAGEDASQDLFPMVVPGGRTWWRTCSWAGASWADNPSEVEVQRDTLTGYLRLTRIGTGAEQTYVHIHIPVEARGLELVGAKIRTKCLAAYTTALSSSCELVHTKADGTEVSLGSASVVVNSVQANSVAVAWTLSDTPIIAEGDWFYAVFGLDIDSGGSAVGQVRLDSVALQFREGRTS